MVHRFFYFIPAHQPASVFIRLFQLHGSWVCTRILHKVRYLLGEYDEQPHSYLSTATSF